MKKILGYNIISDKELAKQIEDVRRGQKNLSNALIARLLKNAEFYRQLAGGNVMLAPRPLRIISETRKILNK